MKIKFTDKKFYAIALSITIGITVILQISLLISSQKIIKAIKESEEDYIPAYAEEKPMLGKNALYCLYECGGKIGIYDARSNILIDTIDVFAASLPKNDRKALQNGIEIYSFKELSQIIDDLTS